MLLQEHLTFAQAGIISESYEDDASGNKSLYLNGCFIQGDLRNHNQRVYPVREISNAVNTVMEQIKRGDSVLGECDHPEELTVNLDRVSHMITDMSMDSANGVGKLKILPTPTGNIIKTLIESGVKLGVSSRGSGNVDDNGYVSEFEIVTVDIVAKPSAPGAYPQAVYEALAWNRKGNNVGQLAEAVQHDRAAQKYLTEGVIDWIKTIRTGS